MAPLGIRWFRGPVIAMLAGALLAGPLVARAPAAAEEPPSANAVATLRATALFWEQKGQSAAALAAWQRLLALAPDQADAVAAAGRLAVALGDRELAATYRDRLRSLAPRDRRLASLDTLIAFDATDLAKLAKARALAKEGKTPEALQAYAELLHGRPVPPDIALEYFQAQATTSVDGLRAAIEAFGRLAADDPLNAPLQLAYAHFLTYHESTRTDGIRRLRALAHGTAVREEARSAWREVLLWQGASFEARDQLETYLKENPSDPELEAKRQEYRDSLPSEGVMARMRGYEALQAKNFGTAEREFTAALAFDHQDAEALIMLAVIRRAQNREAEAEPLIERAMKLAPGRRAEFVHDLGDDVRGQYEEVARATRQGDYRRAERLMRGIIGSEGKASDYVELAQIQASGGQPGEAEASYRQALARDPHNVDAAVGLSVLVSQRGRGAKDRP